MKPFNYNEKYLFKSDGTWFDKDTYAEPEFLWHLDGLYENDEIPYDVLISDKDRICGLFEGICHIPPHDGYDGEVCGLDEFEIILKDTNG